MSTGTAELAPPNEGGDDRDPDVLLARMEELLDGEYPSLDDQELEEFLKDATDVESVQQTPEQRTPEPIEFTETEVGQKGLHRRYRQAGLGIHAGYLSLQRQTPRVVRTFPDGTKEFVLGDTDTVATHVYARTMSVFGASHLLKHKN